MGFILMMPCRDGRLTHSLMLLKIKKLGDRNIFGEQTRKRLRKNTKLIILLKFFRNGLHSLIIELL